MSSSCERSRDATRTCPQTGWSSSLAPGRAIAAPLLLVIAEESEIAKRMAGELAPERLSDLFRTLTAAAIPGAGHRVHHERPEAVAALLERFLDQSR